MAHTFAIALVALSLPMASPGEDRPGFIQLMGWGGGKPSEIVPAAADVGFTDLIVWSNESDYLQELVAEGRKHGIGIYSSLSLSHVDRWKKQYPAIAPPLQVMSPEEDEALRRLQQDTSRGKSGYQYGGEPRLDLEVLECEMLCFHHPEVAECYKRQIEEILRVPGLRGIALDFFGYRNYRCCRCPRSMELSQEFSSCHPELSPEDALREFSLTTLVQFNNDLAGHARAVRPGVMVTTHVYPVFLPEPLYGNRLDVDLCGQTAAWFFEPYWEYEKIRKYSQVIFGQEKAYHARSEGCALVGVYDKPEKYSAKSPQRIAEELKAILDGGGDRVQVCSLNDVVKNQEIAAVFKRFFKGPNKTGTGSEPKQRQCTQNTRPGKVPVPVLLGPLRPGSAPASAGAAAKEIDFTISNPAAVPVTTVARVSLPVPAGLLPGPPPTGAIVDGEATPVQAKVLTRHPDGSIRRVMLSLPISLPAKGAVEGTYRAGSALLPENDSVPSAVSTDRWKVVPRIDRIELRGDRDTLLATIERFGPETADAEATARVLDTGPHFVWLRYDSPGNPWGRQWDVQILRTGELRLAHRIQAKLPGDHWTPDFGWKLTAPGARVSPVLNSPARFLGRNPNSHFAEEGNGDLIAQLTLNDGGTVSAANPLALRQNRGTFEAAQAADAAVLCSNRNEPVDDLETEGLMIQEGAWRFSELVVAPVGRVELAARLDAPVYGHADWRAYDAVYHTGPPLSVEHPVLGDCVEKMRFALCDMQMKGDDLGSMPWRWHPRQTTPDYTSAVRLNHVLYVWEDWFRGGDPVLQTVAHDWCRNYFDLGMYWGDNPKYYGACRRGNAWRDRPEHGPGTFNPRFDNTPIYVHKGWSNFWLMYEETGDPRYRDAAEAAAEWSIRNQHAGPGYTRTSGVIADAVKMYEYTGDRRHLDNAVRLWKTFQPTQGDDLLFTESGKPAVGNDLYIGSDALGYKTPFVKPYIVQYATNALPYLLRHTPEDQRLRATIVTLNDWMARVGQPGGGWGYPHPATAGLTWNPEYVHGLLLAYEIEPRAEYLDAAARNLRPIVQLCGLHGWPASGIEPWEAAAGIGPDERQERYRLAADRDGLRDYEEGRITFNQGPDRVVYFPVVLRDYLKHRDEGSLFEVDGLMEKIRRLATQTR